MALPQWCLDELQEIGRLAVNLKQAQNDLEEERRRVSILEREFNAALKGMIAHLNGQEM